LVCLLHDCRCRGRFALPNVPSPTDREGSYRFVCQRTETVSVLNVVMFRILGLKCFKAQWLLYIAYHPLEHEEIPRFIHKMYSFHTMAGINTDYFPEEHELN
jgi:hypothetical protein